MNCPCCFGKLLAHCNRKGLYWYCPSCRQVMPVLKKTSPIKLLPSLESFQDR